ncbi:Protein phosphatase 1 regulatory subunit 16A [Eumeta japonica]|uniref:Protein phosphatase 1 regulatory subunit 16A n=1 Tax=Eumeta variegata TaxID=151549 RepID=A0A4C1VN31_EUMVA|nr:Protein phosphatase 1 regulatory subunit 16A [Eumeta japonica]
MANIFKVCSGTTTTTKKIVYFFLEGRQRNSHSLRVTETKPYQCSLGFRPKITVLITSSSGAAPGWGGSRGDHEPRGCPKMEHADLVAEMAQVEHLTTQERLHLARRRRIQQLKFWQQREKEWARTRIKKEKSTKRHIYFSDSVMLLEAAARNDIEEGSTPKAESGLGSDIGENVIRDRDYSLYERANGKQKLIMSTLRRLLARGVTPDATNEDGLTALHQCCIDNNEAMMRLLLDHGANVNAEDSEKWTPLHAAATCGNLNLVKILIQRGANLLAVNGDGNMPYDICEEERTLDAIESEMAARGVTQKLIDDTRAATEMTMLMDVADLAKNGVDLDEPRDNQGATLLHIASANGYVKVVEFLLENRASTDVVDHDMWQPVHAAACWGHLEVLELLVQYGADLNVRNKHDETPADICEDGEMRARILRLAAEQEESRRRAAAAAARHTAAGDRLRGARRSSSTASSSRVRSVRRTSLREKQLAAKADARGEARLRETFDSAVDDDMQIKLKLKMRTGIRIMMDTTSSVNIKDVGIHSMSIRVEPRRKIIHNKKYEEFVSF